MGFHAEDLKFQVIYPDEKILAEVIKTGKDHTPAKVKSVMGDLIFPAPPDGRPYLYGCMVLSFDGKMGFYDNPEGTLISKNNTFDEKGAKIDFWIMNVCRCYADAVIMGTGTLRARMDKLWYASIADPDLIDARRELGRRGKEPLTVIASEDGTDIPFEHAVFTMDPPPVIITSKEGARFIKDRMSRECRIVEGQEDLFRESSDIRILVSGEKTADTQGLLGLLRQCGLSYISVEAPGYIWHLIREGYLDEYMLDYSGVMAGGNVAPGTQLPFSFASHPHAQLLHIGYTKGFIFTRQKLIYDH